MNPPVPALVLLVVLMVVAVCVAVYVLYRLAADTKRQPRRATTRPRPPTLEPRDPDDPFCSCPKCELVGHHQVERYRHEKTWLLDANGEPTIAAGFWGEPAEGTPMTRRTCCFCGHSWARIARVNSDEERPCTS